MLLSNMLKKPVITKDGRPVGVLADVIVHLSAQDYPRLSGIVLRLGSGTVFLPIDQILDVNAEGLALVAATVDLRPFQRRLGEVLLRADVLGCRAIDVEQAELVRVYDVDLARTAEGWAAVGLDTRKTSWWDRGTQPHALRDWREFEPLVGFPGGSPSRDRDRLARLKAAQLADLIEQASGPEQADLTAWVSSDPELEADVFEELHRDEQHSLFALRADSEVAGLLARMQPDDAADALMELAQDRRAEVLARIPPSQRVQITRLLKYNPTTAGGMMVPDFLQFPADTTVGVAISAVQHAEQRQPEASLSLYSVDREDRLVAVLGLVAALRLPAETLLLHAAEPYPVSVPADAEAEELCRTMADHNLLLLPVVDEEHRILGVVTVDDALAVAHNTALAAR